MGLRVSGKNFDIGEALREHVLGRLQSSAEKYFKGLITGHVVVDHEGSGYRTDLSTRHAERHMAAAANPLAAEAGREMLRQGGSAIDAAIAMQAVLTLVEPQSSGIGGGALVGHGGGALVQIGGGGALVPPGGGPPGCGRGVRAR